MAAEQMTQIIAGELLNEIERIAPEAISNGFLEEVRPKLAMSGIGRFIGLSLKKAMKNSPPILLS